MLPSEFSLGTPFPSLTSLKLTSDLSNLARGIGRQGVVGRSVYDNYLVPRSLGRQQLLDGNAKNLRGVIDLVKKQPLLAALQVARRRSGDPHGLREGVLGHPLFTASGLESPTNLSGNATSKFRGARSI